MNEPEIITAIIGAAVALLVCLLGFVLNIFSMKALCKHQKEIEKIKFQFEKEKIEFLESLSKKSQASIAEKRSLNVFQALKDSGYSLMNTVSGTDKQYFESLKNWELSLTATIWIYQETYMDVEDDIRTDVHKIKNILHTAWMASKNELFKFYKKKKTKKESIPMKLKKLF